MYKYKFINKIKIEITNNLLKYNKKINKII